VYRHLVVRQSEGGVGVSKAVEHMMLIGAWVHQ
jgi:hypothetical protein